MIRVNLIAADEVSRLPLNDASFYCFLLCCSGLAVVSAYYYCDSCSPKFLPPNSSLSIDRLTLGFGRLHRPSWPLLNLKSSTRDVLI